MTLWFRRRGAPSIVVNADPTLPVDASSGLRPLGQDAVTQAFADITSELINQHLILGRRGFAICGASAGAGVSHTAMNLAVTVAYSGVSTLLIEADLRTPCLGAAFEVDAASAGLLQFLQGQVERQETVTHDVASNLSLMVAGGVSAEADDLLSGDRFRLLVRDSMRDYRCVIVDTPPANRFADASTVAAAVGYAVIVGRNNFTYLEDVKLLSDQLKRVGVTLAGSIFNGG